MTSFTPPSAVQEKRVGNAFVLAKKRKEDDRVPHPIVGRLHARRQLGDDISAQLRAEVKQIADAESAIGRLLHLSCALAPPLFHAWSSQRWPVPIETFSLTMPSGQDKKGRKGGNSYRDSFVSRPGTVTCPEQTVKAHSGRDTGL